MFTMFAALTAFLLAGVIYGIYKSDTQTEQDYGFSETPLPRVTPHTGNDYRRLVPWMASDGEVDWWCLSEEDEDTPFASMEINLN